MPFPKTEEENLRKHLRNFFFLMKYTFRYYFYLLSQANLQIHTHTHIYISGKERLGNQSMQSIMQANCQGGEGKGEPYSVPSENYLPPSLSVNVMWINFKVRRYTSTNRTVFRFGTPLNWTWCLPLLPLVIPWQWS